VLDELSPDEPPRPQKKAKARRSKP
jgi:hypothetical protein